MYAPMFLQYLYSPAIYNIITLPIVYHYWFQPIPTFQIEFHPLFWHNISIPSYCFPWFISTSVPNHQNVPYQDLMKFWPTCVLQNTYPLLYIRDKIEIPHNICSVFCTLYKVSPLFNPWWRHILWWASYHEAM